MTEERIEIDRISTAVQNAHLKVIEKGGTSTAPYLVANLASAIDTIPEATEPTLQSKSVTPSETAQTVKPDSGFDGLSSVSVGAISKTYVGSSVPKQAAQTITPGTADKTIASGRYLTGTQTIKGDANLQAGNIKSGVSIFGVAGTMTAGEDVTAETETYTNLLTDLEAAVDALPDAGSGSGGTSIDTCTVTITSTLGLEIVIATCLINNKVTTTDEYCDSANKTIENVVCDTYVLVKSKNMAFEYAYNLSGAEYVGNYGQQVAWYKIIAPAGGTATINIYDAD